MLPAIGIGFRTSAQLLQSIFAVTVGQPGEHCMDCQVCTLPGPGRGLPRPPLVVWIQATRIPGLWRESIDVMAAVQSQAYFLLPGSGVEDELGQFIPP